MLPTLPSLNDYQEALQHPEIRFRDPVLKRCKVENDPNGFPWARSGGFALTYKLFTNGNVKAVRCFYRSVPEREARYTAICRYISTHSSPILIPVRYLSQGLLVKGIWFPITVMDWVEGDTLETYIVKNIKNETLISALPAEFKRLVAELERLGIAHGDISHRNIMVRNGNMVLIDYDGMFVPEIGGQKSTENGSPYFQHPRRNANYFNASIDYFSCLVIYIGLQALAENPALWSKFGTGGEGLLLKRDDFLDPFQSRLLRELEKIPSLQHLIPKFRQVCLTDVSNTPRLIDFLGNRSIHLPRSEEILEEEVFNSPYPVLNAAFTSILLERGGEMVSVVGKITDYRSATTRYGSPYIFLNFGNWRQKCFTVVIWSEALNLFNVAGKDPLAFIDQWVCVNGMLTSYNNKPQIVVSSPTEIENLIDEAEAQQRLSRRRPKTIISNVKRSADITQQSSTEIAINRLYDAKPEQVQKTPAQPSANLQSYSINSKPINQPIPTQNTITTIITATAKPQNPIQINSNSVTNKLNTLYANIQPPVTTSDARSTSQTTSSPAKQNLTNLTKSNPTVTSDDRSIWYRLGKVIRSVIKKS